MTVTEYLPRTDVQARYSLSRSTLYDWINKGKFPKPVKLGPRIVRWKRSDLENWEQERQG